MIFSAVLAAGVVGPAPGAIEGNLAGDPANVGATDAAGLTRLAAVDAQVADKLLGRPAAGQVAAGATPLRSSMPDAAPAFVPTAAADTGSPTAPALTPLIPVPAAGTASAPVAAAKWAWFDPTGGGGSGPRRSRTAQAQQALATPEPELDRFIAGAPPSVRPLTAAPFDGGGGGLGPRRRAPTALERSGGPELMAQLLPEADLLTASSAVSAPAPASLALLGAGLFLLGTRRIPR